VSNQIITQVTQRLKQELTPTPLFNRLNQYRDQELPQDAQQQMFKQLETLAKKAEIVFGTSDPSDAMISSEDFYAFLKTGFSDVLEFAAQKFDDIPPPPPVIGHFYKIKTAGGRTLGYLLGTQHVIHSSVMPLNTRILKAMGKSERLFLEINDLNALHKHAELTIHDSIHTSTDAQVESALEKYVEIFKKAPIDSIQLLEKIAKMGPREALAECLSHYDYIHACLKGTLDSAGNVIHGIDDLVYHIFNRAHKPILGLEDTEDHFSMLKLMTRNTNIAEGLLNPSDPSSDNPLFKTLAEEWCAGIPEIRINKPGTQDYLISEMRSAKFSETIYGDLTHQRTRAFYAFGLAHLYDGEGVIQGLRDRGLQVVKVKS